MHSLKGVRDKINREDSVFKKELRVWRIYLKNYNFTNEIFEDF